MLNDMQLLASYFTTLIVFTSGLVSAQQATILSNVTTPSLNVTTSTARNNVSILQCWSIPGFAASATAGTSGALNLFLGNVTNSSFTVIPPRFDGGVHVAPVPQSACLSAHHIRF